MSDVWVTDMTHFLDSAGHVPARPAPLAAFLGAIVSETCAQAHGDTHGLSVRCRRRPANRRCAGQIHACIDGSSGEIHWYCPVCSDQGSISNWAGSPWDARSGRRQASHESLAGSPSHFTSAAARAWERLPQPTRIKLLNNVWCGNCRGTCSIALATASVDGGMLVLRGTCTKCGGEVARAVERGAW